MVSSPTSVTRSPCPPPSSKTSLLRAAMRRSKNPCRGTQRPNLLVAPFGVGALDGRRRNPAAVRIHRCPRRSGRSLPHAGHPPGHQLPHPRRSIVDPSPQSVFGIASTSTSGFAARASTSRCSCRARALPNHPRPRLHPRLPEPTYCRRSDAGTSTPSRSSQRRSTHKRMATALQADRSAAHDFVSAGLCGPGRTAPVSANRCSKPRPKASCARSFASLSTLVHACQADAKACDPAAIGDDDKVVSPTDTYQVRWPWLRKLIDDARNPNLADRAKLLDQASARLDDELAENTGALLAANRLLALRPPVRQLHPLAARIPHRRQ